MSLFYQMSDIWLNQSSAYFQLTLFLLSHQPVSVHTQFKCQLDCADCAGSSEVREKS